MAFQLLSSLALFVAATFQAASQRPSVLSACFLALFGAERMATSVAPVTQHALLTRTQLSIWRRALVLSMFAIAGECVVQGLYVSLGPHWPRSAAGARALRWLGFAELDGASAYLADFFPFFALACFASAQLFLHRVAAAEVAALTIGLPGTRVGAHATEAAVAAALAAAAAESGTAVTDGGSTMDGFDRSVPSWATPASLSLAVVAGASVPSFAAAPYLACALLALATWGLPSRTAVLSPLALRRRRRERRRTAGGILSGWFGVASIHRRRARRDGEGTRGGGWPKSVAQFAAVYAAAHFALMYAYQLPELTATANAVRAQWLGLYVLGGSSSSGWVNFFEYAHALSVAGLFWCLCAAGALRPSGGGGGTTDRRDDRPAGGDGTESELSETPRSSRGAKATAGVSAGFRWPPWRHRSSADADAADDDLDEPLLRGESSSLGLSDLSDPSDDDDDAGSEDDVDGARLGDTDGQPARAAPIVTRIPDLETRLFARFAGTIAGLVCVVIALASKCALAYPPLVYGLLAVVTPPSHSSFSKRLGPALVGYLGAWCAAEYAFISIPDAVVPDPETSRIGKLLSAVGLHRVDALTTAEGQFRVFGILAALGAVTWLTRTARACPTESEIEEAAREANGTGLPPDFVRLETGVAEEAPEVYGDDEFSFSDGGGYDSGDGVRSALDGDDGDGEGGPSAAAAAAGGWRTRRSVCPGGSGRR